MVERIRKKNRGEKRQPAKQTIEKRTGSLRGGGERVIAGERWTALEKSVKSTGKENPQGERKERR